MSYVKKEEVSKSPIKRTECRVHFLTAAKIRARARSLTCNACSQALLLGRLLVPLVDHHLPAMNINNAKGSNLRVHFKNTRETCHAIKVGLIA